jgi:hypothetical protein
MTPQFEPSTLETALVVLDAVIAGRIEEVRADLEKLYAAAMLLVPKKHRVTKRAWTGRMGIAVKIADGEVDYSCAYCRESVATLGCGGGQLPKPFVLRLERHTIECACRLLIGGGQ